MADMLVELIQKFIDAIQSDTACNAQRQVLR